MIKWNLVLVLVVICVFLGGCAKKGQIASSEPLCLAGVDTPSAMLAAKKVLVAMDFHIAKLDPSTGYIRTKPLEGSQFFEYWRKDNADAYKAGMSNIHSIRRTVELDFKNNNGSLCIECVTTLSRLEMPEKEFTNSANVYAIYSDSSKESQTLSIDPEQRKQMQWVKLGRDGNIETVILRKIHEKITEEGK